MRDRLLLCGAALAAFGASLGSGFHFDDYGIFSDALLTVPGGWETLASVTRPRPLTDLTYWLNFVVGGRDPFGYHAVNLILHLAAVWLAFECARRLLPERAALLAAALFAVHPLQAEAVNYVWARGMLLGTALCLAALLAWLQGKPWAAVIVYAAAVLAQPECAALPLALLFVDRKPKVPLAIMFGVSAAAFGRALAAAVVPMGSYVLAEGVAITRYLRLLAVPYGFTIDPDVRAPALWMGVLVWTALLGLTYLAWRQRWLWVLAGLILLMASSVLFPSPDLSADRRMYLPMLAFTGAAALALERVQPTVWKPAAFSVAVVLVALSVSRDLVWMNDPSLWREAVRRSPGKVRPRIQLARSLPAGQALEVLSAARQAAPQDPELAAETGRVLLAEGQADAAIDEFTRALSVNPRDALSLNNRGVAFEMLGRTPAARADFERALEIDPGLTQARENLARLTGER